MIDVNIFIAMEIIGGVLVIAGVVFINPKGTRANLSLLTVLIGAAFFASGLCIGESKIAKGTPIEFSEIKDQNYLLREVLSGWRIVKIDSEKSGEDEWKIVRNFPVLFDFSEKGFTKSNGKIFYPKKSSP